MTQNSEDMPDMRLKPVDRWRSLAEGLYNDLAQRLLRGGAPVTAAEALRWDGYTEELLALRSAKPESSTETL